MLYVGIDQHRKQLTVSVRDESGDVLIRRQVSTEWTKVRAFFTDLRDRAAGDGGYAAIVEVCGFNHWLLKLLPECGLSGNDRDSAGRTVAAEDRPPRRQPVERSVVGQP